MIMYLVATGKQHFDNCAHDLALAFRIYRGTTPEISKSEAPECYIDLMKRCWSNNRPNATDVEELINLFQGYYCSRSFLPDWNDEKEKILRQFKEAEAYRKANRLINKNDIHPQAYYKSRKLNPYTEELPSWNNSSVELVVNFETYVTII